MSQPLFWWPTSVETLTVEETDDGFCFSAEDGTEAANWLAYYSESDERRELFRLALLDAVRSAVGEKTWDLDATIHYFQDARRMCPASKTTREAYHSALKHLKKLKKLKNC